MQGQIIYYNSLHINKLTYIKKVRHYRVWKALPIFGTLFSFYLISKL